MAPSSPKREARHPQSHKSGAAHAHAQRARKATRPKLDPTGPTALGFTRADFPPTTRADMEARGWDQCDFVYVSGDAYVDHPSFGAAIIVRLLESHGFRVGVIAQPDWRDPASVAVLGAPRLAFLVSGGNMDSMVNHYSVTKHRRRTDAYTPGGIMGARPDHAVSVYGNLIRRTFKETPIILGGIEASLRRLAHYDYWQDRLKRSILLDSGADLISYGMGERSIVAIAEALDAGLPIDQITFIDGTVYRTRSLDEVYDATVLPSWDDLEADRLTYAKSFNIQYENMDPMSGGRLVEPYPHDVFVVQNPPSKPLSQAEFDEAYDLPYTRTYHPDYEDAGGVPALKEVKMSLISNRGCFGECSFCALTFHQGRIVQARSHESLLAEARKITQEPDFKGYINDVGGPTANFRQPACKKQLAHGACVHKRCLWPKVCRQMDVSHRDYVQLLRELRALPGVKKVFVRSGIRFDYALADPDDTFIRELCAHHVSGQLKVAPEHVSDAVLSVMGKPSRAVYDRFVAKYREVNRELGKKQYLVPYLMSSHPGSTLKEAVELAEYVRDMGYMPEQVQDFYPTPSTMSTCMYYTGVDPRTMKPVYVPKTAHEKALQRALIQYRKPENYDLVREALIKAGREDLIGYGPKCLIRPTRPHGVKSTGRASAGRNGKGQRSQGAEQHDRANGSGETTGASRHAKTAGGHGRGKHGGMDGRSRHRTQPSGGAFGRPQRGSNAAGRNRAGQGREANRGGHRG
ncbi:YgiQ family radical SAM protein [Collinsella sp. An2]|uniref:YgiQ family radical SAM protein n=1 Tax=Collinsella sp. An2 TaxID=1965585 RepID=UPI001EF6E2A5|nr:YgiQ family radical SAM protein [Collinsella sp. An2]